LDQKVAKTTTGMPIYKQVNIGKLITAYAPQEELMYFSGNGL